jgi:DnaJ-domain-containing protein 1
MRADPLRTTAADADELLRNLEKNIEESRDAWSDRTRQLFDTQHTNDILRSARSSTKELQSITDDLRDLIQRIEDTT